MEKIKEFWRYQLVYGSTKQVFKLAECSNVMTIHESAQFLMDNRHYTMSDAYKYLNNLNPF
jgi:hypothetical protein